MALAFHVSIFVVMLSSSASGAISIESLQTSANETAFVQGDNITLQAVTAYNSTLDTYIEWWFASTIVSNFSLDASGVMTSYDKTGVMSENSVNNNTNLITTKITLSNITESGSINITMKATAMGVTVEKYIQVYISQQATAQPTVSTATAGVGPTVGAGTATTPQSVTNTAEQVTGNPATTPGAGEVFSCTNTSEVVVGSDELYTYLKVTSWANYTEKTCITTNETRATSLYMIGNDTLLCGGGCPRQIKNNVSRTLCFKSTGECAKLDGTKATNCSAGYSGLPFCNKPICHPQDCGGGTCVAPNLCEKCPIHTETGPTCRNVKLQGFLGGSLVSCAVLTGIIILLCCGSHFYKKHKVKAD